MDQKERIAQIIQEYDSQGWHRTGTVTDHQSAGWLADKARELGVDAETEQFNLSRIDPELCYLEVDGQRIEGLPMYDGTFTVPEGIYGHIGPLGSSSEIGLAEVRRGAGVNQALQVARQSSDYKGIVAVTMGGATWADGVERPRVLGAVRASGAASQQRGAVHACGGSPTPRRSAPCCLGYADRC